MLNRIRMNRILVYPNVKRDGVQHKFTEEEIKEYIKCGKDPVYFCKTLSKGYLS